MQNTGEMALAIFMLLYYLRFECGERRAMSLVGARAEQEDAETQ